MPLARPNSPIRSVAYFGTPQVAVPQLEALIDSEIEIALVVTKPPAKRGRGSTLSPTPVEIAARAAGITVSYDPNDVLDAKIDLGIVVAYGRLIRPNLLDVIPMVNLHFSLLPKWRGAAPVERAILAGDTVTGVCLMALDYELDTGEIYSVVEEPILETDTVDVLRGRLVDLSVKQLLEGIAEGLTTSVPQVGESSYAKMLDKSEFIIDFGDSAELIERKTRVRKCTTWCRGKRVGLVEVEVLPETTLKAGELAQDIVGTSRGALKLKLVQPESKPAMSGEAWLRGFGNDQPIKLGLSQD